MHKRKNGSLLPQVKVEKSDIEEENDGMRITELLTKETINLSLKSTTKTDVIEELSFGFRLCRQIG